MFEDINLCVACVVMININTTKDWSQIGTKDEFSLVFGNIT